MSKEFNTRTDDETGLEIPCDPMAVLKMCQSFGVITSNSIKEFRKMRSILDQTIADRKKIKISDEQVEGLLLIRGVLLQADRILCTLSANRKDMV